MTDANAVNSQRSAKSLCSNTDKGCSLHAQISGNHLCLLIEV